MPMCVPHNYYFSSYVCHLRITIAQQDSVSGAYSSNLVRVFPIQKLNRFFFFVFLLKFDLIAMAVTALIIRLTNYHAISFHYIPIV